MVAGAAVLLLALPPSGADLTVMAPSAPELQAQLDAAVHRRDPVFTIPPGAYNFTTTNLEITGATAIRVVAAGVTLWFGGTGTRMPGVNISNCDRVNVSGPLTIDYYGLRHARSGIPGITYNLLNSSDVTSEDITIVKAPFFSVTAFNGGGGHVFRRFHLPADTGTDASGRPTDRWPHERDAFHFSDLRRGVVLEDSDAAGFGDDFFNSHNTLMIVLRRESPTSLLLVNPHLQNVAYGRNTVYGTNCALENVRGGDTMSFFAYPDLRDCRSAPLGGDACTVLGAPEAITDGATLADAATLAKAMIEEHGTIAFDASDVWRVKFRSPVSASVGRAALVNIDSFSTPGTIIRNNVFNGSKYNIGRFKSNGGLIINNTFTGAGSRNLEITPLPWYFEGNLPLVRDVIVSGNTFLAEGTAPIHCSPYCGQTAPPKNSSCALCTVCQHDSPWAANISVSDNHMIASMPARS